MIDVTSLALLAASFFFVVLSAALLVKYRELSEKINVSTDLGRDLWASLEQRLKKQDERILDMMGRFEVIQARAMMASRSSAAPSVSEPVLAPSASREPERESTPGHNNSPSVQQPESRASQESQGAPGAASAVTELDDTQWAALKLLGQAPKNTRELTNSLGKSREHTARVMKELFEMGLVQRNASSKPFVYQLTDGGRSRLSSSQTDN